jgi:ribosomal-protein-alanine N-acetyltransferase
MIDEWSIRRALLEDLDGLLRVAGVCAEASKWSEPLWQRLLVGEGEVARAVFVAERGGELVGFLVAAFSGGVAEIESVAVLEAFRRMGLGRALCMEAMSWARSEGASDLELEVRASSLGAIALYEALGFVEQGRRPGYYRHPVDDAVLMTMNLHG